MIPRKIPAIGEPVPQFYLEKRAVVFLTDNQGTPAGTAFFVELEPERPHPGFGYLVTAKHIVDGFEHDTKVRLRLRHGGTKDVPVSHWVLHPEPMVDVAVSPAVLSRHEFDYSAFLMPSKVQWEPSEGDDIFYIGLLRDVPSMGLEGVSMVRGGVLGAWLQEAIPWRDTNGRAGLSRGRVPVAHLIDVHSHGGFSGSPCLAFEAGYRGEDEVTQQPTPEDTVRVALLRKDRRALLGFISGHFPHPEEALTSKGEEITVHINSGVAVVTPTEKIMEVLEMDELDRDREARRKERSGGDESGAVHDSGRRVEDEAMTQSGFIDALEKVSRPDEPPPDEASK